MKNKWGFIAYGMAWIATAIAISVAIYITENTRCLWFLLIPALISVQSESTKPQ